MGTTGKGIQESIAHKLNRSGLGGEGGADDGDGDVESDIGADVWRRRCRRSSTVEVMSRRFARFVLVCFVVPLWLLLGDS